MIAGVLSHALLFAGSPHQMPVNRNSGFVFADKHPLIANTLLVIVTLVVTVLVIDLVAFYLLERRPIGWGPRRFFQHSSLLGWEHIPYAHGTWYAYKDGSTTQVRINAYGFPDDEREVAGNRPRIALIGDSTTEFWEVQQDERPQRVMPRLLEGRAEVLNFGLRGAGTDQELIRYMQQVVLFSPDVVVLFFCVNDYGNNAEHEAKPWFELDDSAPHGIRLAGMPIRGEQLPPTPWYLDVLERSFTLRQAKYATVGIGEHFRAQVPLETHLELRPYKRDYDGEDERRLELLKRLIARFVTYSREQGIHFLLVEGVERPVHDEETRRKVVDIYGDQFDFDRVTRVLEEHSAALGYQFLSLPRILQERKLDIRVLLHAQDTMHLNARGAQLFATEIANRIRALGWLEGPGGATAGVR
jgi:lysophospholipase L1-like esterase